MAKRWLDYYVYGKRHYPVDKTPGRINSSKCLYRECALDGWYCDGITCPGCVNIGGDYECAVDAMSDFDALRDEINALRQELAYIKHRTMKGGW